VFAFWAARQDAIKDSPLDLPAIFQASRDHGLEPTNLAAIGRTWAPRLALAEAEILEYLNSNICYYLDNDCREGLELFYRYARECGILPEISGIEFLERKPALI
jgi:predicted solute-binding protein